MKKLRRKASDRNSTSPTLIRTEVGPRAPLEAAPFEETHAGRWEAARLAPDFKPLAIDTPPFRREGDYFEPHEGVRWEAFRWLVGKPNAHHGSLDDDAELAYRLFQYVVDVTIRGSRRDWSEVRRLYKIHTEGNKQLKLAAIGEAVQRSLEQFHGAELPDSRENLRHREAIGNDDAFYRNKKLRHHRAFAVWNLLWGEFGLNRWDHAFRDLNPASVHDLLSNGTPSPSGRGKHEPGAAAVAAELALLAGALGAEQTARDETRWYAINRIAGSFRDALKAQGQETNPLTDERERFERETTWVVSTAADREQIGKANAEIKAAAKKRTARLIAKHVARAQESPPGLRSKNRAKD